MSLSVLGLLYLLQVWPSSSQFVFEFELVSVDTIDYQTCDDLQGGALNADQFGPCEPFLQIFCLREGRDTQSTNTLDCPLGSSNDGIIAFTPSDVRRDSETRPGLPDGPVNRTISSQQPWPGTFQLYIEARELDPPSANDPLDNIFINRTLKVNADFTLIESYNGTSMLNRVVLDMRFRVMCQQDYYGTDCTRFCVAQNDSMNGYYTCNSGDGSIQCREGFRNPNNNCREAILACDSRPCANGGNCTSMGAFEFICQCAVGYTGPTCEVNIDDCVSATCPSNSMCVDGVNTFECIQTETLNTAAIGAGVAVPLVVIILIIIVIAVLVLVVSKRRTQEKPFQGQHQKDNSANSAHQLEEKFIPTTAIYATPSSPEATVRKLDNPVYGDISDDEDDVNAHDFQNPVYGEAEDDGAQQDELYTTPQAPQPAWEGDGPEYDYATNPGAGVVTVNVTTNGLTPASHKYTAMDESKRKMVELDVMEPYERLQHGIEPPDFVRLAEIEGAEYGSLQ